MATCSNCGEKGHTKPTCGQDRTVSRQRRWQLKKLAQGLCQNCGRPSRTTKCGRCKPRVGKRCCGYCGEKGHNVQSCQDRAIDDNYNHVNWGPE